MCWCFSICFSLGKLNVMAMGLICSCSQSNRRSFIVLWQLRGTQQQQQPAQHICIYAVDFMLDFASNHDHHATITTDHSFSIASLNFLQNGLDIFGIAFVVDHFLPSKTYFICFSFSLPRFQRPYSYKFQ